MFNLTEEKRKKIREKYDKKILTSQKKRKIHKIDLNWLPMEFSGGALDGGEITNKYRNVRSY